jgi:hypothetical protein
MIVCGLSPHWETCLVIPSLAIIEIRCPDEKCHTLHGIALDFGWLWLSFVIQFHFAKGGPSEG